MSQRHGVYYGPRAVPCECGSRDAYWHGDTLRVYACDACWATQTGAPSYPGCEENNRPGRCSGPLTEWRSAGGASVVACREHGSAWLLARHEVRT